jgi:hypothetical protein
MINSFFKAKDKNASSSTQSPIEHQSSESAEPPVRGNKRKRPSLAQKKDRQADTESGRQDQEEGEISDTGKTKNIPDLINVTNCPFIS